MHTIERTPMACRQPLVVPGQLRVILTVSSLSPIIWLVIHLLPNAPPLPCVCSFLFFFFLQLRSLSLSGEYCMALHNCILLQHNLKTKLFSSFQSQKSVKLHLSQWTQSLPLLCSLALCWKECSRMPRGTTLAHLLYTSPLWGALFTPTVTEVMPQQIHQKWIPASGLSGPPILKVLVLSLPPCNCLVRACEFWFCPHYSILRI